MIEEELRRALAALVDGLPPRQAAGAVERLMAGYRAKDGAAPVLRDRADVVAYAAYRMPATFAAVAAALDALAVRTGGWRPVSHLDVGGGTGAAVWAAAQVWGAAGGRGEGAGAPEEGTHAPRRTTVLDRSEPALALGRELARACAADAAPPAAEWTRRALARRGRAVRTPCPPPTSSPSPTCWAS